MVAGVPLEILTVPSTDRIGRALSGTALKPEESVNYSFGGVLRFGDFNVTLDAYQIELTDRIVLSENLNQPAVAALLAANGIVGINSVRFFLNFVDSTTTGADLVASYRLRTDFGRFDFTGSLSVNEIKLDRTPVIPALTAIGLTPTQLFNRINTLTLSEGQPKEKAWFNTNWTLGKFGTTFKATYYGEVTEPGTDAARDIVLTPEVLFDIEGRYKLTDKISLTLGVENATDVYPRMTPGTTVLTPSTFTTLHNSGASAFSRYSPFGFSGRYVHGRVSLDFEEPDTQTKKKGRGGNTAAFFVVS